MPPTEHQESTADRASGDAPARSFRLALDDAAMTVAVWGDGPADVLLLHDGLGSIGQWRTIPRRLAERTGLTVLAYDRPGHGRSTPVPTGPWPADWLHREAERLGRLLGAVDVVERPLLVGHSDGGSIALIHAAAIGGGEAGDGDGDGDGRALAGLVTLAAHSWVEQTCVDAIAGMRHDSGPIVAGLRRYHTDPAAVFEAWSGVWVSDGFRPWDIRPKLSTIGCPTMVVQGRNDEYATDAHAIETATAIGDNARWRLLDDVGHLLHHQDPELIVETVADLAAELDADRI